MARVDQAGRDADAPKLGLRDLLLAALDQTPHRPLHMRHRRALARVEAPRLDPLAVPSPCRVEVEEPEFVQAVGVLLGRPEAEPDDPDRQRDGYPVGPDSGPRVDHEPAERLSVLYGVARRQRAAHRVPDERRPVLAGLPEQSAEPLREHVRGQVGHGLGLAEAGNVRNHDAVALGEPLDHRCPVRTPGLDGAMQQDQRRAVAAFEHHGRHPGQPQPALSHRQAVEHPVPCRAHHPIDRTKEAPAAHRLNHPTCRLATVGNSSRLRACDARVRRPWPRPARRRPAW